MADKIRRVFEVVDHQSLMKAHVPAPEYFDSDYYLDPEAIEARQLTRLRDRAERAYAVPFFNRRWKEAGFAPADLRFLNDLAQVPAYTVDDIRKSIEAHPPLGDYQGVDIEDAANEPLRVFICLERQPGLRDRHSIPSGIARSAQS